LTFVQSFAVKAFKNGMIDGVILNKLIDTEIDLLKALCHPNIVAFHELFVGPASRCMVMEYCSGGDLSSRLEIARTSG
jgi:serine/threonine protein kinase